jgi:hypothetical protein
MKKIYTILLILPFMGCVKQKIQDVQEDLVVQAVTNGQWKVTTFTKGSTDITNDFANYKFQFYKDNKVDAINNSITENTGSWSADANAKIITTYFTNSNYPLNLFNGTWNIITTTWTSVNATLTVGGEVRTLRLDKL